MQSLSHPTDVPSPQATFSFHHEASPGHGPTGSDKLPSFIKPLSETLDAVDAEFLEKKGAFTIPPPDLRNEIIAHYLQFIHPSLPVLTASMLRNIAQERPNPGPNTMSILLFQAAMFAAVNLIDEKSIQKAGYSTAHEIRKAFYARARVSVMPAEANEISLTNLIASLRL